MKYETSIKVYVEQHLPDIISIKANNFCIRKLILNHLDDGAKLEIKKLDPTNGLTILVEKLLRPLADNEFMCPNGVRFKFSWYQDDIAWAQFDGGDFTSTNCLVREDLQPAYRALCLWRVKQLKDKITPKESIIHNNVTYTFKVYHSAKIVPHGIATFKYDEVTHTISTETPRHMISEQFHVVYDELAKYLHWQVFGPST
jgi:hypothetical protein